MLYLLKLSSNSGSHGASVGHQFVKPRPPERDHGWVGESNTAECRDNQIDDGVEQHRDLHARTDGSKQLAEGNTEEKHEDEDHQLEASAIKSGGALAKSDRKDLAPVTCRVEPTETP